MNLQLHTSGQDDHDDDGTAGSDGDTAIRDAAARWVVRRDRRLSSVEAAELAAWLQADPRHAAAYERSAASWGNFRALGTAVRRSAPAKPAPREQWNWPAIGGLAAAVLALAFLSLSRQATPPSGADPALAVNGTSTGSEVGASNALRRLADGSVVHLKPGAEIAAEFSAIARRVRLVRGEAFFEVAKEAARPFLVEVGGVTVRAVGTAFAIRFEPHAVDVLVTEGTVRVTPPVSSGANVPLGANDAANYDSSSAAGSALVEAGHRAVVARKLDSPAQPVIVTVASAAEIALTLAWKGSMLELAGATLGELAAGFAARSGQKIEIDDPALAAVRIGGQFPPDDVNGFIRALAEIYDVKSERRADGTIVLRKNGRL